MSINIYPCQCGYPTPHVHLYGVDGSRLTNLPIFVRPDAEALIAELLNDGKITEETAGRLGIQVCDLQLPRELFDATRLGSLRDQLAIAAVDWGIMELPLAGVKNRFVCMRFPLSNN